MRTAFLVVLCLALAGCTSGDGGNGGSEPTITPSASPTPSPSPGPSPGPGPAPVPQEVVLLANFHFRDCVGTEVLADLDPATVQAALPEGYTVATAADATGAEQAVVQIVMLRCASFDTNVGAFNDTVLGWTAVQVEAPDRAEAADQHWYRFRMLADEGLMTDLWTAAGYDVHTGTFSHQVTGDVSVPGALLSQTSTSLGGYSADLATTTAAADATATQVSLTEIQGGLLSWGSTDTAGAFAAATGLVTVAADDPLSSAFTQATPIDLRVRTLQDLDLESNRLVLVPEPVTGS